MALVRFLPDGIEAEVNVGDSILDAAEASGAPEGSACGGNCACSTCHVYVRVGGELLSEMEDDEADRLDMAFDVRPESRLGCQTKVTENGLVVVEISPESRKAYYDEHPALREAAKRKGEAA